MRTKNTTDTEPEFVEFCPDCGSNVYAGENSFWCSNGTCCFRINRRILAKFRVDTPISVSRMRRLIQGGCIPLLGLISPKTGDPFDCIGFLEYDENSRRWWIKYDFEHFALGVFKQIAANKH